jgi:AcrR family transcriptional regulator
MSQPDPADAVPSRVITRRERPGKAAILRAAVSVMGEDGYEGASMRDMAARSGVTVAALYYHFPSKLDLLREFLEEAWDVVLARLDRRLAAADPSSTGQLDAVVHTLIWSYLHDEYAEMASNVALREFTRLDPPDRAAIDARRLRLLERVTGIVEIGVGDGSFESDDPRETARAIVLLCGSLVEPYHAMGMSLDAVIAQYQHFARRLAGIR